MKNGDLGDNLSSIPVRVVLPDGRVFERSDVLGKARISDDLEGESKEVAADIATYGYLYAYLNSALSAAESQFAAWKSGQYAHAKANGVNIVTHDGSVLQKAKPSEKEVEASYRMDAQYAVFVNSISELRGNMELFRSLYYAHRSKSDQISNLIRMSVIAER